MVNETNENPYRAPSESEPPRRPEWPVERSFDSWWDSFFWTFASFAGGTLVVAQILGAGAMQHRVQGGMLYGGIPLAIVGLYFAERRRRRRTSLPPVDSTVEETERGRD